MADNQQTLIEFTQNLLSDVSSGALSVEEAVAACNQYAYLREAITARKGALSSASLLGEDELKKVFSGTLEETLSSLSELPSFQQQSPDSPRDEKTIRDAGSLRKFASERVQKSLKEESRSYQDSRRAFIHDLVNRYSRRVPGISDETMDTATDYALAEAAKEATSAQTKDRFAEQLIASLEASGGGVAAEQKNEILSTVQSTISDHKDFFQTAAAKEKRAREIYEALAENPDLKRADVLVDVVLNAPSTEDVSDSVTRGVKLARVADSLEEHEGQGGRLTFFTQEGTKGVAKGLQQGADGILSVVGDPVRDMVYHQKVNGVFRSMVSDTQRFVDRLGESFVKSSLFTHISQDLTKQLADRPQTGVARGAVDDIFSSIFRGPLTLPLNESVEDRILDYFELARANANAPANKKFLPSGLPPWDAFRKYSAADLRGSSRSAPRFGPLSWLPSLSLGPVGRIAGDAFSSVVDRTTSFLLSNPLIPQQLSMSRRAAAIPTPFWEDMPLLISTLVIATIVLLFVLPTPLNLSQVSHSSKITSLLAGLIPATEKPPETSNDNGWPVKCGCIINGPLQDTHSTNKLNAIDFSFKRCKPSTNVGLYAVAKGKVTLVSQTYGVGESCVDPITKHIDCHGKSTYGNYIEITITEGAGKGLTVLYAHMATIKVHEGQNVDKGELVGTSNHNGLSYQEHLHFELLGKTSHPLLDTPNPITPQPATNGLCVGL